MIIVAGQAQFDTRYLAEIQADIREIEAVTRREDGCLYYAMAFDDLEQGLVTVLERWRDEAALNAHLLTPALKAFQERNLPRTKSFSIKLYEIAAERDLIGPDHQTI